MASASLLAACTGSFTPINNVTADAGPDQLARDDFESNVEPILATRCYSCHETGQVSAPIFAGYEAIIAYAGEEAPLVACTTAQSRLYTKGSHVNGAGPPLDAATEAPAVATFIGLWAASQSSCTAAGQAATGGLTFVVGLNTVDLSTLGTGLEGATLSFDAQTVGQGLYLSAITVTAGLNGLHVTHPRFETCPMGSPEILPDEFAMVDATIPAGTAQTLGDGAYSILNTALGDKFGIRFEVITPEAGSQGAPVDNGGACAL